MVRFSHIADCHLGGWRQPELQELNLQAFKQAIEYSIKENVDFTIIAGDLFDSAYPSIEILKETFHIFSKLREHKIPCFIIGGSHDYSVSGKTFLDVLDKAGFCKNIVDAEERNGQIILNPTIYKGVALYGYPGKKSGLEIEDLKKMKLQEAPGLFKVLVLHTTMKFAKGNLPIESVDEEKLPKADYYALGHLHIDREKDRFVYGGPTFPNNFQEMEDLKEGKFYIFDSDKKRLQKIRLKLKDIESINITLTKSIGATEKIIDEIKRRDIADRIVLLRINGELEQGKSSDIKFSQIEEVIQEKQAYCYLKNTSELKTINPDLEIETENMENIEEEIVRSYSNENPSRFNNLVLQLMDILDIEKQEDEKNAAFEKRVIEDARRVLKF